MLDLVCRLGFITKSLCFGLPSYKLGRMCLPQRSELCVNWLTKNISGWCSANFIMGGLLNWGLYCWSQAVLLDKEWLFFFLTSAQKVFLSYFVLPSLSWKFFPSSVCVYMLMLMDILWTQTFSQCSYCACSFDGVDFQLLSSCLASHPISPKVSQLTNRCRE